MSTTVRAFDIVIAIPLPMALAGSGSYVSLPPTLHTATNIAGHCHIKRLEGQSYYEQIR
ncbi:MAG: hypothetical protein GY897_10290 [Alteromonas sp.]|nr:hypothetical protein [Alteromonas sp.]